MKHEFGNLVSCVSKIFLISPLNSKAAKPFCDLYLTDIPMWISSKLDFEEGDCLVWRYYDDAKVAVVYKREGWKSRNKNHDKPAPT